MKKILSGFILIFVFLSCSDDNKITQEQVKQFEVGINKQAKQLLSFMQKENLLIDGLVFNCNLNNKLINCKSENIKLSIDKMPIATIGSIIINSNFVYGKESSSYFDILSFFAKDKRYLKTSVNNIKFNTQLQQFLAFYLTLFNDKLSFLISNLSKDINIEYLLDYSKQDELIQTNIKSEIKLADGYLKTDASFKINKTLAKAYKYVVAQQSIKLQDKSVSAKDNIYLTSAKAEFNFNLPEIFINDFNEYLKENKEKIIASINNIVEDKALSEKIQEFIFNLVSNNAFKINFSMQSKNDITLSNFIKNKNSDEVGKNIEKNYDIRLNNLITRDLLTIFKSSF